MRSLPISSILILGAALGTSPLFAQGGVPYNVGHDWESYLSGRTTGGAFADLDRDGHLDLVVANGNDMARQRVEVFYNDGAGHFPVNPQWQSGDIDYHGHLAVGDVNQDGWPDVAVSVFIGPSGFSTKGRVKLYLNQAGTLESTPSWTSTSDFWTFSLDLGDADGDGDLDLAVATGEPYYGTTARNRIYYNSGGTLATTPGWQSNPADHTLDVTFGDVDRDGDLDLAFATAGGPTRVFFQGPAGISTTAGWSSTDNNNQNGNSATWADVDNDGYLELAITDNEQLGGSGVFKIYDNVGGVLDTTPYWSDYGGRMLNPPVMGNPGYVSAIAFADVNLDGATDLAGGIWWDGVWIYLNDGGGAYPSNKDWQNSVDSVAEALFFGDVDNAGLLPVTAEVHATHGGRTYYVDHPPIQSLTEVRVDGVVLGPSEFCFDREDGWICLDRTPAVDVSIDYVYSDSLDMGLTNWDSTKGNYVFYRYPSPRATFRNAAPNPASYTAVTLPVLGTTYTGHVDVGGTTGHSHALLAGYGAPLTFSFLGWTGLVNPGGPEYLGLPAAIGPVAAIDVPIPTDPAYAGYRIFTQAAHFGGGPPVALSNAQDLTLGF